MSETVEIDVKELFKMLWKRCWIILLCAVLVGTGVLMYTLNFVEPQYTASVSIYVNNNSGKNTASISSGDLAVALRLVGTYVNIIKSDTVLDKVIQETGLLLTSAQLRNMLSAEVMDETEMFKVTITTNNPQMSMDLANAVADVAPGEITNIIEGSSAKIIDYAKLPQTYSSPNYLFSAILGILAGAMGAVIILVVIFLLDMRIKSERDLTNVCTAPILGRIPNFDLKSKKSGRKVRR